MINNTKKFLVELEKIASKFEWSLQKKKYGNFICEQILGEKDGREYIPLTAVSESISKKYYNPDLFDKAAGELFMSAQVSTQILDACDDWPDKTNGYKPKGYEISLREDIIKIVKPIRQ